MNPYVPGQDTIQCEFPSKIFLPTWALVYFGVALEIIIPLQCSMGDGSL